MLTFIESPQYKTNPTAASVEDFINTVTDEQKRKDSFVIFGNDYGDERPGDLNRIEYGPSDEAIRKYAGK